MQGVEISSQRAMAPVESLWIIRGARYDSWECTKSDKLTIYPQETL